MKSKKPEAAPLADETLDAASGGALGITLTDVIISSYQTGGASGAEEPIRGLAPVAPKARP